VTLVLALPRAASLKKVLQQCAAMGIKRFLLIGAQRVEKSYWSSSALDDDSMKDHLCLGLEQARDTVLPVVEVFRRFRAFVDERLAGLLAEGTGYLASPEAAAPFPSPPRLPAFVVLGPEGGFMPGETARLVDAGLFPVSLGPRILRVETAAVAMVARALA
jgi:RsmE family RNA methyltransferase